MKSDVPEEVEVTNVYRTTCNIWFHNLHSCPDIAKKIKLRRKRQEVGKKEKQGRNVYIMAEGKL
jgi:hypothetical protein